ncbi:MAG: bifunctional 5,10-methylene-tetrahydrofolate dehydrogenase/5,10-methylene-tetrahydrofolate cyclohydrolase [Bacteroidetes bacterium GWE2_29_8]|nr:MAG: bifunctional 5,10-methylene-tetrahydrofolate dehydrogenase/5,10-methylene-tetrahydrofolate cyclohydrolase [Bacteroidetes bacterium GWE2_29_8]OFY15898.1 MAG: bifunctional 5,10-methylene-tetrahydrofolate dehydrogenase/5,10-methylene-tetrahydrofolate cyclohydrolase [Bacteroidetes bacterium GWF2_29_10]
MKLIYMKIIDGKLVAQEIRAEIAKEVAVMIDNDIKAPHLVAILVGDDGASHTYVENKRKACESVGMTSSVYKFSENVSEKELLDTIDFLNNDNDVDGFIVQEPLPKHISSEKVLEKIDYRKDVDGFHPINVGKMMLGIDTFLPATPFGIVKLLERYKIETEGKNCVIIGRSHIVGSPLSMLLSRNTNPGNCTVTICHSKTKNLAEITSKADILIAALGKPQFVTADMVKEGATVIDVGTTRLPSTETKSGFKLFGDVKFDEVSKKCSYITPVPGGVGPMTIVGLLLNTLKAAKNRK